MLAPSTHLKLHLNLEFIRLLMDGNVHFVEGLLSTLILKIRTAENNFRLIFMFLGKYFSRKMCIFGPFSK